jgi:hypothetical protein
VRLTSTGKSIFSESSNRPFDARKRLFDAYIESIHEFVPGDKDFVAFFTSDCLPRKADAEILDGTHVETPSTSNTLETPMPTFPQMQNGSPTAPPKSPTSDIKENEPVDINKGSYLAKKGKGQNGYTWKKRYFALRNGLMDCLEKA